MPSLDALADRLLALREQGSIARSRLAGPMRERLALLFDLGVLRDERRGAGWHVVLHEPVALDNWIRTNYPSGLGGITGDLADRTRSVANHRDSKRVGALQHRLVHVRGFGGTVLTRRDTVFPLAELTKSFDVAGLALDPEDPWSFAGTVALVENAEVFMNVERLAFRVDAALFASGRIDGRVLRWLVAQRDLQVLHVGDYDPVGLDEYLRLRRALGNRVELYVPDDLEDLVARYGQRSLLSKSLAVYERVRRNADERVATVIDVLDRYGRGLEHEALLIHANPPVRKQREAATN